MWNNISVTPTSGIICFIKLLYIRNLQLCRETIIYNSLKYNLFLKEFFTSNLKYEFLRATVSMNAMFFILKTKHSLS